MKEQIAGKTEQGIIHGIKKADIVLIAVCLLASALLAVFLIVQREAGSSVRIMHDGIELKRIDLYSAQTVTESETSRQYYLITYRDNAASVESFENRPELPEGISYNLISVTGGTVVVEAADCRDQICARHKPISSKDESIICLPHRLVVEIVGEGTAVDIQYENIQNEKNDQMHDKPLDGVVR